MTMSELAAQRNSQPLIAGEKSTQLLARRFQSYAFVQFVFKTSVEGLLHASSVFK